MAFFYSIIYVLVVFFFLYLFYRIIDNWVNKSVNIRKKQNDLLKEIIKLLEKK
jgi:hypothetical protein